MLGLGTRIAQAFVEGMGGLTNHVTANRHNLKPTLTSPMLCGLDQRSPKTMLPSDPIDDEAQQLTSRTGFEGFLLSSVDPRTYDARGIHGDLEEVSMVGK